MIAARIARGSALAGRLAANARRIAIARAETQRRTDERRWRETRLLWPLFAKDLP